MDQQLAKQNFNNVKTLLEKSKSQIELALPKHLNAERFARIALTELRKNPFLLNCEPKSFLGAVIQSSQLGLELGSSLGHAYAIPFYNSKEKIYECQFIIGYRGMIDLARRSGQILSISAQPVYSNEVFEFEYGINETLRHIPIIDGDNGQFKGAYAIAQLQGGGYQFDFVPKHKIDAIKEQQLGKIKSEYAKKYSPWVTAYEEMARKTAVRRLFKYLPVSVEMQRAITLDEQADFGSQKNDSFIDCDFDIGNIEEPNEIQEINDKKLSEATKKLEN